MGKMIFRANGEVLDLYEDNQVATSYSVSKIEDLDKTSQDSNSKTIKIPGTNANRKKLQFPDQIGIKQFVGQKTINTGEIEVDGSVIMKGLVNLSKAIIDNGMISYEAFIFGNSKQWRELIKDSSLGDLDFSEYNHIFNLNAIKTQNNPFYKYPLIDSGKWSGGDLFPAMPDFIPYFNVALILQKIFNTIGYQAYVSLPENPYQSLFMSSQNLQEITTAIVDRNTFTAKGGTAGFSFFSYANQPSPYILTELSGLTDKSISPFTTEINNKPNYTALKFTAQDNFRGSFLADINVQLRFDATTTGVDYTPSRSILLNISATSQLQIFKQGKPLAIASEISNTMLIQDNIPVTSSFPQPISKVSPIQNIHIETPYLNITKGDVYYAVLNTSCQYSLKADNTPSIQMHDISFGIGYNLDSINGFSNDDRIDPNAGEGNTIYINTLMPEIKQLDFLKAIRHLFDLMFYTDQINKAVYITPFKEFYTPVIVDWSNKVDYSEKIEIEELGASMAKTNVYKYKEDSSDYTVAQQIDDYRNYVGQNNAYVSNLFAKQEPADIENAVFSPTYMDKRAQDISNKPIPRIWREPKQGEAVPDRDNNYAPRLLFISPYTADNISTQVNSAQSGTDTCSIPYALFYGKVNNDTENVNLSFNVESSEPGLLERYYTRRYNYINKARKITCFMRLSAMDIENFVEKQPDKEKGYFPVYILNINGDLIPCRIQEIIDFNPSKKSTKCVFITEV